VAVTTWRKDRTTPRERVAYDAQRNCGATIGWCWWEWAMMGGLVCVCVCKEKGQWRQLELWPGIARLGTHCKWDPKWERMGSSNGKGRYGPKFGVVGSRRERGGRIREIESERKRVAEALELG
jgi:hypothetical protein